MKNWFISVLVATFLHTGLDAQSYHPIDTSNLVWNELKESSSEGTYPPDKFIESYVVGGDTIIENLRYYKVYILESNDSIFIGCFREAEKIIYYTGVDYFGFETDSVVLLYDFNKQKDDTIHTGAGYQAVIEDIDSLLVGNSYRKRFHMQDGQDWIEGIGSSYGFLYPMTNIPTMYWRSELICYKHHDSLLFLSPNFIDCNTEKLSSAWGPIGTTWYYSEKFAFSGDVNYMKFESFGDTIIENQNCIKLVKEGSLACNGRPDIEYMYSENNTVFFFDDYFKEFQILYDFNAAKGDKWIIRVRDYEDDIDTVIISVDSLGLVKINDHYLKSLHVSYKIVDENYSYEYGSTIIERIGDIQYMFNFAPFASLACDANWTDGLRCYEDTIIGHYETGIADSCTYTYKWTSIEDKSFNRQNSLIYPNPTDDIIYFNVDDKHANQVYKVFDIFGRELISGLLEEHNQVNFQLFPSGIYILKLYHSKGNNHSNYRIVKR